MTPPPNPIWTPDFDPIRTRNPPFQVRIESKSGQKRIQIRSRERFAGGRVQRGRSGYTSALTVFQGKVYMQRFSNTSFGRTLLGSNLGASCSNKLLSALCGLPLRVRPPAIEWKMGRNPKIGKNRPKNRKWPSARNGGKMAQKW